MELAVLIATVFFAAACSIKSETGWQPSAAELVKRETVLF